MAVGVNCRIAREGRGERGGETWLRLGPKASSRRACSNSFMPAAPSALGNPSMPIRCSRPASTCDSGQGVSACARAFCRAIAFGSGNASMRSSCTRSILPRAPCSSEGCVYLVPLMGAWQLPAMSVPRPTKEFHRAARRLHPRHRRPGARLRSAASWLHRPALSRIQPAHLSVLVRSGSRLSQMRFRSGDTRLDAAGHRALHAAQTLVVGGDQRSIPGSRRLSIDLKGEGRDGLIGFRSSGTRPWWTWTARARSTCSNFWEPLYSRAAPSSSSTPTSSTSSSASKRACAAPPMRRDGAV